MPAIAADTGADGGGGSRVSRALLLSREQVGTPTTNFSHVRLPESHSDVNRWVKRYFESVLVTRIF